MLTLRIAGIQGNSSEVIDAHVHRFSTQRSTHGGLVVLTKGLLEFNPESFKPFLNDTFGGAMNQNVSFSGSPELILDGGTGGTEWAATALSGTWNFADSGKATITSANNNDAARFDDAGTIDMSSHTALTGKVDLDTYNSASNGMTVQFGLAGVLLGNPIELNNFIDTGVFSEQAFVIPKEDFGVQALTVDEITITITRTGGAKPTVKFDDWQIEQTGTPLVFTATTPEATRFHVKELRLTIVDALAGTLTDGTMPALAYNKILDLSALTNGFIIRRIKNGKVLVAITVKQIGDLLSVGANLENVISDGTNTFVNISITFPEPIVLEGGEGNLLSITINDNLLGLVQFTAVLRGSSEI